eukprot:scaffold19639_cov65-Phaeocystis_antarctica.AAC.1
MHVQQGGGRPWVEAVGWVTGLVVVIRRAQSRSLPPLDRTSDLLLEVLGGNEHGEAAGLILQPHDALHVLVLGQALLVHLAPLVEARCLGHGQMESSQSHVLAIGT